MRDKRRETLVRMLDAGASRRWRSMARRSVLGASLLIGCVVGVFLAQRATPLAHITLPPTRVITATPASDVTIADDAMMSRVLAASNSPYGFVRVNGRMVDAAELRVENRKVGKQKNRK